MSAVSRLKHFGWGREGEGLTAEEEAFVLSRAEARFGAALNENATAPRLDEIRLHAPRIPAPASLPFCTSEHYDRAAHTYGKSYPPSSRAASRATTRTRPTSSPIRATSTRSPRCSTGPALPTRP